MPEDAKNTGPTVRGGDRERGGGLPHVPGYEVLEEIHRGGQGVVYRAVQQSTQRIVAVKVLGGADRATEQQKQRFVREVNLAASLRHPGIVTVYESGLSEGDYFYAMEYVHGVPLDHFIRREQPPLRKRLELFREVCDAVAEAHLHGVVHRDLKPGNILVDAHGKPHVLDFGLAKPLGEALAVAAGSSPGAGGGEGGVRSAEALTITTAFMGTPAYASPEQTRGEPSLIDARSDVYSLGVILYEMLTGRFPYPVDGSFLEICTAIRLKEPVRPSTYNPEIRGETETLMFRALAKEPARRYQSVAALAEDVRRLLSGEAIEARRDSVMYVLAVKGRGAVARHAALTRAWVLAAVTMGVMILGGALLSFWPWPNRVFEERVARLGAADAEAGGLFNSVRVIAIDDASAEEMEALAKELGIDGVDASRWATVRLMDAALMHRLTAAKPRVVAVDIEFRDAWVNADGTQTPHPEDELKRWNGALAAGIRALQEAGTPVVLAVGDWRLTEQGHAPMSASLLETGVRWGVATMNVDAHSMWRANLLVRRDEATTFLSFPLAAVAAMRHPDKSVRAELDADTGEARLLYGPVRLTGAQHVGAMAMDRIRLSAVRTPAMDADDTDMGLRATDLVGDYVLNVPSDDALQLVTIPLARAMRMGDEQLRATFGGRMVLLCQTMSGTADWHPAPGGRIVAGPHGVATTIDAILRHSVTVEYPGFGTWMAIVACGAGLGLAAAHRASQRGGLRLVRLASGALLIVVVSVLSYSQTYILWNPLLPVVAMLAACECVVRLDRVATPLGAPQRNTGGLSWLQG